MVGERRKQHNDQLNDLYFSPNIFRWSNWEEWYGRSM